MSNEAVFCTAGSPGSCVLSAAKRRLLCDPHDIYTIHARDKSILGHAEWYPRWRGYVFSPEDGIVLSWDCCLELSRFLENCNKATRVLRSAL